MHAHTFKMDSFSVLLNITHTRNRLTTTPHGSAIPHKTTPYHKCFEDHHTYIYTHSYIWPNTYRHCDTPICAGILLLHLLKVNKPTNK